MSIKQEKDGNKAVRVNLSVKNVGKLAGAEAVQVYITPITPKIDRPVKELKAFAKVKLQPGRTGKVTFILNRQDFACFDSENHAFTVDPGDYEILIGASSEDIRLRGICTLV